ncbi:MAG: xanthine dehydrogenase accessory protein XdhC [Lachnospiraceae bacterium]|nr:xanthine dehydrogenase accessory protein XdhC [Lachnospiraceae bacterium]
MRDLFRLLNKTITDGDDAVLVTIIASSGSAPRGSGARMLVTKDGRIAGTIGGGSVEYESIRIAQRVLREKRNAGEHFSLTKNDVADIGMICGGNVEVFFLYLQGGDRSVVEWTKAIDRLFDERKRTRLITEITEAGNGTLSVADDAGNVYGDAVNEEILQAPAIKPVQIENCGRRYYIEQIIKPGRVYIFGGGHIAQQLVPILARCDFSCMVIEDREDYADPALFENKADTICLKTEEWSSLVKRITADDFVCIMTRGHLNDYLAMRESLRSPARYIGVIGSRSKIAATRERLMKDGFTETEIDRITAPIGLPILSETPAEIAVSVTAQLIQVRAQ